MENNKMKAWAGVKNGKTVFAAYWTTVEMADNEVAVMFRFPMKFGMLRAADWAEAEIHEAADWYAMGERAQADVGLRQFSVMPCHKGQRKLLYRTGRMTLTLGMGRYQIEMVMTRGKNRLSAAADIDDAIDSMTGWMRRNAYMMQLQ